VVSFWVTSKKEDTGRGSTRSPSVQNSLWKKLRTCRKTDCDDGDDDDDDDDDDDYDDDYDDDDEAIRLQIT